MRSKNAACQGLSDFDHLEDGAQAAEHEIRFYSMTPITDEEFDRQIDGVAAGVEAALRKNSWKSYATVAQLHYPDRISTQGLVSMEGKPETFEVLYEFGKALAGNGFSVPTAVYVTSESVAADGKPCLFISGCSADGRRNGVRILRGRPPPAR